MKMKKIKRFFDSLISSVYPLKCICCGEILDENIICDKCNSSLERVNYNNLCLECGVEKEFCECNYKIFRFKNTICAFENCGQARKIYYSYKFHRKQHYADFFAEEVCNAVKNCYGNVYFDIVCAVPSYMKLGYDHCTYIARSVSKKLNIPFYENLILCVKRTKKQHNSTIKERLINVEGKYMVTNHIYNKNVLLIDDIKTTGATLDECAKMLLFAGADNVYCATVLGTAKKEKIEKL